jgi:putative hemolysin
MTPMRAALSAATPLPMAANPVQVHALNRPARAPRFQVQWARDDEDVRDAQRLRYRVFAGEMGARLSPPFGTSPGLDVDRFDSHCEHLLVRALPGDDHDSRDGQAGEVIGTYRVLTPDAARRAGGYYTESEFDLRRIQPRLGKAVELGRSCVHPAWRAGGVVMALWAALGEFMRERELDTMIGCASVSVRDGGHTAASLWNRLRETHLAPPHWQVMPLMPLPLESLRQDLDPEVPALIKGYLRCGAQLLGAPAWDPEFRTADLPLMMQLADLPARYRRHFLSN